LDEEDLPPGVAAELRLLRAEIAELRNPQAPPVPGGWVRRQWIPELADGHMILPGHHYRAMKAIRGRLQRRATAPVIGPDLINKQRHRALVLLLFCGVRIVAWMILAVLIGAGLLGLGGFTWAKTLAESLPFVVMISIYANWATDLGALIAAFAALVASDVHHDVVATGRALAADLDELEADVARLAGLAPGDEATRLAGDIRRRLAAVPATAAGRPPPHRRSG
jgi:hypothetical protein